MVGLIFIVLVNIYYKGINELCVGVYVMFDCVMVGFGVCDIDDIVMLVLISVIGY